MSEDQCGSGLSAREALEHETADMLVNKNHGLALSTNDQKKRKANYQKVRASITSYSDETLQRIRATEGTDIGWMIEAYLCAGEGDEGHLNDWITMESTALYQEMDNLMALRGLARYEHLTPHQDGYYPARRAAQIAAITRITAYLISIRSGILRKAPDRELQPMRFIEDKNLRDLITLHDDPAVVADIITTRGITDAVQIKAVLSTVDQTAPSINEGVL